LEQKEANGKGYEATILEENSAADSLRSCRMAIGRATGAPEVDVARADPDKRQDRGNAQCGGHEKDLSRGQQIADGTHDPRRRETADRGEALIAPEPFRERLVSDQPQTDGGDAGPEEASSHALDDRRRENRWKVGPQPEDQCGKNEGSNSGSDQHPFCADPVDELSGGNLSEQAGEPAGRQDESDVGRHPPVIRQMHRNKRSEPHQQRRQEEVQPIQRMQALKR
jgi:hypothetical protein